MKFNKDIALEYGERVKKCVKSIYECPIPVICAVNGPALGGGCAITALCDIIIASEGAIFGIPEIIVGVIGGAEFLSLIVPRKVVNYMALTGKAIKAEVIQNYGGIYKVVPKERLMETALAVAEDLLAKGPTALQYFKKSLQINLDARLDEKYDVEIHYTAKYCSTDHSKEAQKAFLEKRKPEFRGK